MEITPHPNPPEIRWSAFYIRSDCFRRVPKIGAIAIVRVLLTASLLLHALPLRAVERYLKIEAVPTAQPGQNYRATIKAGTDAGGGEQIGMFQVDISLDDGKTWSGARYLDGLGASTTQGIDIPIGSTTSPVRLRVRVAFRGGLAGDVDFRGAAIRWQESWAKWEEPPAQSVRIQVITP